MDISREDKERAPLLFASLTSATPVLKRFLQNERVKVIKVRVNVSSASQYLNNLAKILTCSVKKGLIALAFLHTGQEEPVPKQS